ncbi:MAG: hypothetical protein JWM44_2030 [Bacilli bacterium]|nr:hypothetical protein [Bacilli bacterium]
MNKKRVAMIGTLASAITFGDGAWVDKTSARTPNQFDTLKIKTPLRSALNSEAANKDKFLEALGAGSDEEVHDALNNGKSLAAISDDNNKDIQIIIDLHLAEMTAQLDSRLASGSLSFMQYQAQKSELAEILTRSAFGRNSF